VFTTALLLIPIKHTPMTAIPATTRAP
jgi:hypothetical protein